MSAEAAFPLENCIPTNPCLILGAGRYSHIEACHLLQLELDTPDFPAEQHDYVWQRSSHMFGPLDV